MRRPLAFSLLCGVLLAAESRSAPKDPLRFFSAETTQIVGVVPNPRAFAEAILNHPRAKDALALPQVKELLDSADLRKLFQLLAYYEKDLGAKWPELLDQLAGDGVAVGGKFGDNNAPVLAVLQGRDEAQVTKLVDLLVSLVEDERTRAGGKEGVTRKKYEGVEAVELSKDLLMARVGGALLVSNKGDRLKAGIDQHVANGKDAKAKNLANADVKKDVTKLLGGDPLAWAWVNLKPVKELPEAKATFTTPRNDVVQTVLLAGILDVARRADFIAAGFFREKDDLTFTVRMPAGRKDTAPDVDLHLPKDPKVGGSLPPFDLPGMLACHSFYMDFETFYTKSAQIFPPQTAKDLKEAEKQISKVMINTSLPKFLAASGVHHRVVAVQPEKVASYPRQPETRLPAVALVTTMRDPSFAKSMNSIIKAGALAVSTQASVRSWEEEIEGVTAFGYDFPEKGKFPDDPQGLRFNYQPTFASVEGQYIFASNKGLCRDLIKAIRAEGKKSPDNANLQTVANAKGFSEFVNVLPELPLAAMILSQGVPLDVAKKQTAEFYKFLDSLGVLTVKTEYTDTEFHFDIHWKLTK